MSRTLYLVCYDVGDPVRLRRVGRFVRAWRVAGQKSVHECWLTPAELREISTKLEAMLDPEADRAHILQLDPRLQVQCFGVATTFRPGPFLIV